MAAEVTLDGDVAEATGWTGRVLEFLPDGTELVTFDDAAPREAEGPGGKAFVETWQGSALYDVTTSGDTLSFDAVDFANTSVTWEYGNESGEREPENRPPSPVTYTCDDTTHTQRSDTYERRSRASPIDGDRRAETEPIARVFALRSPGLSPVRSP